MIFPLTDFGHCCDCGYDFRLCFLFICFVLCCFIPRPCFFPLRSGPPPAPLASRPPSPVHQTSLFGSRDCVLWVLFLSRLRGRLLLTLPRRVVGKYLSPCLLHLCLLGKRLGWLRTSGWMRSCRRVGRHHPPSSGSSVLLLSSMQVFSFGCVLFFLSGSI